MQSPQVLLDLMFRLCVVSHLLMLLYLHGHILLTVLVLNGTYRNKKLWTDSTSLFFFIEEYKRKKPTGIKTSNTFKDGVFAPSSDWDLPVNSL